MGLLALMLIQESRRAARSRADGELVLLEDQDRSLWDRALIAEGVELTTRALKTRMFGPYCLQAAIAAVHAEAPSTKETDWSEIIGLYDVLSRLDPSPVVALNRAVAVSMRDGPEAALPAVTALLEELEGYHLAHAAHADLCRRLGRTAEAIASYEKALALSRQEPERRFLQLRIDQLR
jgi:RNA polymerase sigma-70 factor (ECF subfamily)